MMARVPSHLHYVSALPRVKEFPWPSSCCRSSSSRLFDSTASACHRTENVRRRLPTSCKRSILSMLSTL